MADPVRVADALARGVHDFISGRLVLENVDVRRVRIKGRGQTALYRATVTSSATGEHHVVDLEADVQVPGTSPPRDDADGASFGTPVWRHHLESLGLDLRTAPPDTALPAMPTLTDPDAAQELLEASIRASSPRYARLRIATCSPNVVRYKRGSRCTVLYRLTFPDDADAADWPRVVVAKTYHGSKGRNAYEGMRGLWESRLRTSAAVTIPEPLAFVPDLNVFIQAGIPGDPTLKDALRAALRSGAAPALDEIRGYLAKTGAGLAELHGCGFQPADSVTWNDEVAEARQVTERLGALVPGLADGVNALVSELDARAAGLGATPLVASHRSFRPAQVLLDDGRIGFIDFDGVCRAEPELDVALFRATVRDIGLRILQAKDGIAAGADVRPDHQAALDDLCDAFLRGYEAAGGGVSRERVALWEAIDLVTAVLHTWTKVKFERLDHRLKLLRTHLAAMGVNAAT